MHTRFVKMLLLAAMLLLANHAGAQVTPAKPADKQGTPALIRAVETGDAATVTSLMVSGADPNVRSPNGWTPLMLAVIRNDTAMLKLLIEMGADANATDRGEPLLVMVARAGTPEMMQVLLERGARVDAQSETGRTALMAAAAAGRADMVRLLLNQGADPALLSSERMTALQYATANGQAAVVELLDPADDEGLTWKAYAALAAGVIVALAAVLLVVMQHKHGAAAPQGNVTARDGSTGSGATFRRATFASMALALPALAGVALGLYFVPDRILLVTDARGMFTAPATALLCAPFALPGTLPLLQRGYRNGRAIGGIAAGMGATVAAAAAAGGLLLAYSLWHLGGSH